LLIEDAHISAISNTRSAIVYIDINQPSTIPSDQS
jgi:hypothetical protein